MSLSTTHIPCNLRFALACLWMALALAGQAQTLGEALNATNLNWTTGGSPPWVAETNVTHDGQAAAFSGLVSGLQANWIQTTVSGPAAVDFWWKVSSVQNYSLLTLDIGGVAQTNISGEVDWQFQSFYVPSGPQTVLWTYTQNALGEGIPNAGWLDEVSISTPAPPVILTQPTNQSVSAGSPASLAVLVSGCRPLAFQWQQNGADLAGATAASWSIADAQAGNAGDYRVVVSGPVGDITSQVGTLVVVPAPPTFTLQPVSQGAAAGADDVIFTAAARGSESLTWQWYFNGGALPGATTATLSVQAPAPSSYGSYWAVVTNSYGSATTAVATISYSPVVAWGDNTYGQCAVAPGATNVVSLAGGDFHCLALRADGTVTAWGSDDWSGYYFGQAEVPVTATNVLGIAAGSGHSLAVREDGTVVLWGTIIGSMTTNVPANATNVIAFGPGPGAEHALALRADGTVLDWGGYPGRGLSNLPTTATNIVAVSAGAYHSLALRADGRIVAWGDNSQDQTDIPAAASNVVAISSGWFHNLALRADGELVQWGFSWGENVGSVPPSATNIVSFACGGNHSLALRADGTLFAWGNNQQGETLIPAWATNLVAVAGTSFGSLALVADGPARVSAPLVSRSVLAGQTTYFRATAVGALPLSYQWRLDGTDLAGATNPVLVVENAQPAQAGPYSIVVSNALGMATSAPASLTVVPWQAVITGASLAGGKGSLSFTATSPAGLVWILQGSTDLNHWLDLTTMTNATGTMTITQPVTNSPLGFYRLRWVR